MDSYICPQCNQIYKGWSGHTNCFVCGTKLVPYTDIKDKDKELPITSEFPIENLPYTIKATRFGDSTIITFTDTILHEHETFAITVYEDHIYISTAG